MSRRPATALALALTVALFSSGCDDFCPYSCEPGIYLTVKSEVPDTTVALGQTLRLDLRDYFQLGEDSSEGEFAGYPNIKPTIEDTSVAKISYDYQDDRQGEGFSAVASAAGTTQVKLSISWDGGGDTGQTAYADESFDLFVEDVQQ